MVPRIAIPRGYEHLTISTDPVSHIHTKDDIWNRFIASITSVLLINETNRPETRFHLDCARTTYSPHRRLCIYWTAILQASIHACETWLLRSNDAKQLETFDHWCLLVRQKLNGTIAFQTPSRVNTVKTPNDWFCSSKEDILGGLPIYSNDLKGIYWGGPYCCQLESNDQKRLNSGIGAVTRQ